MPCYLCRWVRVSYGKLATSICFVLVVRLLGPSPLCRQSCFPSSTGRAPQLTFTQDLRPASPHGVQEPRRYVLYIRPLHPSRSCCAQNLYTCDMSPAPTAPRPNRTGRAFLMCAVAGTFGEACVENLKRDEGLIFRVGIDSCEARASAQCVCAGSLGDYVVYDYPSVARYVWSGLHTSTICLTAVISQTCRIGLLPPAASSTPGNFAYAAMCVLYCSLQNLGNS